MVIFLDANILFSAAQTDSPSRQFVLKLADHALLTTHAGVWEEAERNLKEKRHRWMPGLEELSHRISINLVSAPCPDVGLPAKDQPVLGAAIGIRADRLVTGDRAHFGLLFGKTVHGVKILSPQMMVEEMKAMGWISSG